MTQIAMTRLLLVTLAAGLVGTACSAPAAEPVAATAAPSPPTSLRLGFIDGLADAQVDTFLDELGSRSAGSLTVEYPDGFSGATHGAEQTIVRAVADGRLDLGWVGARAFAELGVRDLDVLVAPMVLDSVAAQDAVLASDVPDRMLDALEPLGVTGLAVVPGPVRRPIAADRPLTRLADFRDVPFHAFHADVNAASVTALGAALVDVPPPERNAGIESGSIRAYENSLVFLADKGDWRTNLMTLDVNLWPSVSVLLANPTMLEALPEDRRASLVAAATATARSTPAALPDEDRLVEQACRGGARFALAGPAELAEIRQALRPVLDDLRRDPAAAAHLDAVTELTRGIDPDVPTIPDGCAAAPTQE